MRIPPSSRRLLVAVPLTLALAVVGCSSTTGQGEPAHVTALPADDGIPTADDDTAVRGLLDRVNSAWARGDATAYAAAHTSDADMIDFLGNHAVGRKDIAGLLQPLFDGVLKNTRVEARIVDLRFLSPTVAIFHTEGQIVPTGAHSVQTFIAQKEKGEWLIAAFQNTRIQDHP